MGLLDDYSGKGGLLGIGMTPRPTRQHQHIKHVLEHEITDEGFYVLSEQCVDAKNLNSPAPDVCIYEDEKDNYPTVIIEITTTKECKTIIEKVAELLKQYPAIKEGFIYDYEKKKWYCCGENLDTDTPSYSVILDIDFDDYL